MPQKLCDRTTCQNSRLRGSHLCREHLGEAMQEAVLVASPGTPLRTTVLGFAAGIGTGLVSSALWQVISEALQANSGLMNLVNADSMRRYDALMIAAGVLRQEHSDDELARAVSALEDLSERDQKVIVRKLTQVLEAYAV